MSDAGWDIRTRTNATPQLERNVEQLHRSISPWSALTALLVKGGCRHVANSAKHYLDRKRDVIATLKALGATGTQRLRRLLHRGDDAGRGRRRDCGLVLGAALPFAIAGALGPILPLPFTPALHPGELLAAVAYGLLHRRHLRALAWPRPRPRRCRSPPSSVTRLAQESALRRRFPRARYAAAAALAALFALTALAVAAAYDRKIAVIFVVAAAVVFVSLRLVAAGLMALARRAPRPRATVWRLAIANIHRPGALTPTVVLSLGLGLALLVTVLEIDANLRTQFMAALPEKAPSFYFLDIQAADAERFDAFLHAQAPRASLERVPMLRGRIVAAGGRRAEDIKPRQEAQWVLQGDRGITYTSEIPQGSRVVEGEWWGKDYAGPPLLSFEKKLADGLGLKLGDEVTVNVLGRNITARIANMRTVDWQSLGINFVLVFSPGAFAGAPVTDIATVTYPGGGSAARRSRCSRGWATRSRR